MSARSANAVAVAGAAAVIGLAIVIVRAVRARKAPVGSGPAGAAAKPGKPRRKCPGPPNRD
ncbi:hypothetical protein ACFV1W_09245 [Kitasatospora sp. NPDC059648]|uniref:hypothetical protein n=1 Tax=Kitasatospora sp. NPDC059648 TaxID=3346894 RepID=UPI0036BFD267